jgi:hypothetical protein
MNIKDKLSKRIEENYKTKDSKSFIEYSKIFNFPKEYKMFKPHTDKINQIIILPYIVKTDNDPKIKKGDDTYILEYFKHRGIGINNESVLCLKKTFGKFCPICEEIANLQENYEANKQIITAIKASKRGIYNVIDLLSDEPNDIKIFDSSFAYFEEEMLEEVVDPDTKEYVCFPDISEDGYIIKFRAVEEAFGKIKFNKYKAFRFEKRKYAIDKKILDKVLSLDEYLIIPTYDEVKNIFLGTDEPVEKNADKEYYEEVVEKQETKKADNPCPHGHKFKIDVDTTDDCIQCTAWEKCSEVE